MSKASINDRASIEEIYPADVFAADAAANDRPEAETLRGVRITSAPDEAGCFAVERAAHHAGEAPTGTAIFLAPFHRAAPTEHAESNPDPRGGYNAFLDEIIATARRQGYRAVTSPGPGDPRLRGLRQ
jgi:hypothetical protein